MTTKTVHDDIVRSLDFIAHLSPAEWERLCQLGQTQQLRRGELVFRAGGADNNIHILETGRVKIFQISPKGKETLLWFCGRGELFGLSELCQGGERKVYAQACEPSRIVAIDRERFKLFIARRPELALNIIDLLSYRLRSLGKTFEGLTTHDVTQRVTALLMQLGERYGQPSGEGVAIEINITHQEMADMIGTTRQSVTSVLSGLKRAGMIEMHKRRMSLNSRFVADSNAAAATPHSGANSPEIS